MSKLALFEASLSEPAENPMKESKQRITRTTRTKSADMSYLRDSEIITQNDPGSVNYNSDHSNDFSSMIQREDKIDGYRSDTSDPESTEIPGLPREDVSSKPSNEADSGEKPVSLLKRTFSGKFRKDNRVEFIPPPVDESLHKAIRHGITVKQLGKNLKKVTHIDQTDSKGQSALHLCVSRGYVDFARLLLKRGANINLQDSNGFTPLHCSVLEKQLLSSKFLLESKLIDVTVMNNEKSNALHYLVRIPVTEDNVVLYRCLLDLLVLKGINIDAQNKHGEAPIHFACMTGNVHAVGFLLERGADCNLPSLIGETSLHYAVRTSSIKLVRLLMENGADPTAKAEDGSTPVDVAEQYQCTDVLDCLQSIIEEELESHSESPIAQSKLHEVSQRAGWLTLFRGGKWELCWTVLNSQQLSCYTDDTKAITILEMSLNLLDLSKEVTEETGVNSEKLYCFKIHERGSVQHTFATTTPHDRDGWFVVLDSILQSIEKLNVLYEKLRLLSKPRKRLRARERTIAYHNSQEGLRVLLAAANCKSKDELLRMILQALDLSAAALSTVVNIDDENIVRSFVKFFMHHGVLVEFLKEAISHDIRRITMGETLFREMSLSTRMLSIFLEMDDGREYLRSTVLSLLNVITSMENSLEISPNSVFGDRINLKAHHAKIVEISQAFLDQALSSASRCPIVFRELLYHTKERVDRVFPNMTHAVVGGFVFLRFFCPAIVSPHKYGLLSKPLEPNSLRVCVLITKLLQSVSNGVEFDGSKEEYMQRLNPFIKKNRLYVNVFFDHLTNIDMDNLEQLKKDSQVDKPLCKEELSAVGTTIFNHISELVPRLNSLLNNSAPQLSSRTTNEDPDSEDEHSSVETDEM